MPELPEVETIRRGLEKKISKRTIVKFESLDSKVVRFAPNLINDAVIEGVARRGKQIIIKLLNAPEKYLIIHLKMTGQLIWESNPGRKEFKLRNLGNKSESKRIAGGHPNSDWIATLPTKHTRAIFYFDDKSALFFNDLRRFGYIKLVSESEYANEMKKLGVEPFSDDFNLEYLLKFQSRYPNRKIKQFLLDQSIIAGIGNIYVDEGLFYAGILPTRIVSKITSSEWQKIKDGVIKALKLGIEFGGSSADNYVDAFGEQGSAHQKLNVYRKTGENCPKCGGKIERISLGGRGTHFCKQCQS